MSKPADRIFKNVVVAVAEPTSAQLESGPVTEEADATRTDFPCSVAQERFWLLDRLDPGNAAYNVAVRWRLEGRIATDLLEHAWLAIIDRHEILRSQFFEVDGAPVQRIMPTSPFRLAEIDLSTLPPDQQLIEADRIGVIEARAPFDLGSGPMIRVTLLRFSPSLAVILVTTHQIVSDGWSIGVMAREMGTIYAALRSGSPIPLEPLPIQYADYSLWQLEWLRVRGIAAETEYWTRQLAGVKPFRVIPDHPRPSMPTTNGAIVSRLLPRELTNRAQALTAQRGATLFASALATLCAMLARYTGESEIVIGTQVSDRDQVELEPMIGQFVNSLILRTDLGDDPKFDELIDRVREITSQALEHRHIPIERLLGMVKGERSHTHSAAISVNFIFQKTFIQNAAYGDFTLTDMPSLPAGAIYDLNFFMVERPDGWRFSCQCNTDQFDEATAARMLAYVENLFDDAVAHPQRRISELSLCAPAEPRSLLYKLNDTRALYPRDLSLVQLFEAQVARAPDAIALACDEEQLTYAELDERADRVAQYLRARGVAPASTVGVCLARSLELPVALLGILKAGAAYVALDAEDSAEHRAEAMATAKAAAVIFRADQRLSDADRAANPIDLDAALAVKPSGGKFKLSEPLDSGRAACLLFTAAGDVPQPLAVSHRSLANLVFSLAKRPGMGERDVLVATCPASHERAPMELFLPLLTGARLVIALDEDLANGRRLLHTLQRVGATLMYALPAQWTKLLEAGWIGYPTLKMICPAQELRPATFEKLAAIGGEIWTAYGHPGAGALSSVMRVRAKNELTSIGEPIANTALYVLDARMQPTAVGATGDVYIGGDGLAENCGEPVVDPAGGAAPIRLLRTGDLGRIKANGQIEYLGRHDAQFSFHGRRVDPSAIERALRQEALVADAVVAQVHEGSDQAALAAYVVPHAGAGGADGLPVLLRTALAGRLPQYLVPSMILLRDAIARSADGTVDRRLLTAFKVREPNQAGRAPNGIEQELTKIWASLLGRESVDVTDNFFELGGHSLLAARMLAQVERLVGRRIKLATLFSAPTIRELANVLSHADAREFDFRQVVKIQSDGTRPPLIGINNTGIYYGLAKRLGADQPVISLQLFDPSVPTATLPETLEGIAAGYVALIRRVQPQGPYELMGWCAAGALAFEISRQLEEQHQAVSHVFLIDSWIPRYFERLPRLRGFVGDYSLRWQFVAEDWRKYRRGEQSLSEFFENRVLVKSLRRWLNRSREVSVTASQSDASNLETYDAWLLGYLQKLTRVYEPKKVSARLTIIRSTKEPTGWFFKEDAGWRDFSTQPADVVYVEGNHFTMFAEPGVVQLASHIAAAITAPQ
jgi:non-ribosomal peptide synthetase component F/thioesterase domain-containing protein/aryl carrier-like protein